MCSVYAVQVAVTESVLPGEGRLNPTLLTNLEVTVDLPAGVGLASPQVDLEGVDGRLLDYVAHLGLIHKLVFGSDLVITSGKEGQHVQNSFHKLGKAVDLRTSDIDESSQLLFLHVVSFSAPTRGVAVFDERSTNDPKHLHLELHD